MNTQNIRLIPANIRSRFKVADIILRGLLPVLALWLFSSAEPAVAGEPIVPGRPLFEISRSSGLQCGVQLGLGRKVFDIEDERAIFDMQRASVRLGFNPLPFLNISGSLGHVQAEEPGVSSGGGLESAVEAQARLLDVPIYKSLVSPRQQNLIFSVRGSYRHSSSDSEDATLNWNEWQLVPMLTYLQDQRGEPPSPVYNYTGLAVRAGLVFSRLRGTTRIDARAAAENERRIPTGKPGHNDIEGAHDLGIMAGLDVMAFSGWVMRAETTFYESADRDFTLEAVYNF